MAALDLPGQVVVVNLEVMVVGVGETEAEGVVFVRGGGVDFAVVL